MTHTTERTLTRKQLITLAERYARGRRVECPDDGEEFEVSLDGELAEASLVFRCPACGAVGEFTRDM